MKIKIFFFIFVSFFLGKDIFAQTGTSPFVGSKHIYFVNSADGGESHIRTDGVSSYKWYLTTNEAGTIAANTDHYTVEGSAWDGGTDGIDGAAIVNLYSINITWNASASVSAPYYLFVQEHDVNDACISIRKIAINVQANAFDINIASLGTTCSDASGSIIVNSDETNLGNTTKVFTIDMETQADMTSATFIPDWKFDYAVASASGNLVSVNFDTNTAVATPALSGQAASGVVTVNADDYSIEMTVVFANVWDSSETVTVTLSNGVELTYNTPDGDATNNVGTVAISALPVTSNIITD